MNSTLDFKINNQEAELRTLLDKIRDNSAHLSDYQKYEMILSQNSIASDEMTMLLRRHGFYSIEQYYNQRANAKTFDERRRTDGELLGSLVGLGGGLLLFWERLATKKK
jgi:hypothetical protein